MDVQHFDTATLVNRIDKEVVFMFDGREYEIGARGEILLPRAVAQHAYETNLYNIDPASGRGSCIFGLKGETECDFADDYEETGTSMSLDALQEEAESRGLKLVKQNLRGGGLAAQAETVAEGKDE